MTLMDLKGPVIFIFFLHHGPDLMSSGLTEEARSSSIYPSFFHIALADFSIKGSTPFFYIHHFYSVGSAGSISGNLQIYFDRFRCRKINFLTGCMKDNIFSNLVYTS